MENKVYVKAKTGIYGGRKYTDTCIEFLGIKYAAIPGRWQAPVIVPDSEAVIEALQCGPACPQTVCREEYPNADPEMAEDCLSLNIWTGSLGNSKPVYVWIHGGCFQTGSNQTDCFGGIYCGDKLVAENPDVVYVNINYRVGMLGSMDLSSFDDSECYQDSKNLCLMDQIAALRWVHENIAAFGGDPKRVTVGGQSAGSFSVLTLLAVEAALPYFNQVICESSGPTNRLIKSPELAREIAMKFADIAGVHTLEELLALPADQVCAYGDETRMSGFRTAFEPCRDGRLIPDDMEAAWRSGRLKGKRILGGTVSGEYDQMVMGLSEDEVAEVVKRRFPDLTQADIDGYLTNEPERDAWTAMADMFNDIGLRCRHIIGMESVIFGGMTGYVYYIAYKPVGAKMRTQHCFEIPYVTGKSDAGIYLDFASGEKLLGEKPDVLLGSLIQTSWLNFIRTGSPNDEKLGIWWPAYTLAEKKTMVIDKVWHIENEVRTKDMAIARKYQ